MPRRLRYAAISCTCYSSSKVKSVQGCQGATYFRRPRLTLCLSSMDALAVASGVSAHVWQPFSKEDNYAYFSISHGVKVHAVSFNLNNKVIVSAGESGRLLLHYNRENAVMGTLPKATGEGAPEGAMGTINALAFSRGSKLLAAGCEDSTVHVWDLKQQVLYN